MSDLKNKIFNRIRKSSIYLRYVDDILLLANDINKIHTKRHLSKKFSS